jgi:hypothetical protein
VHVLSAFAYVGGLVLFWILVVAVRRVDTPEGTLRMEPIVKVGSVAIGLGAVGTIVIYLAFAVDGYAIWDGWIIAALVLWAVSGALGQRTGAAYMQGMNKAKELDAAGKNGPDQELLALNRTQSGLVLHALVTLAVLDVRRLRVDKGVGPAQDDAGALDRPARRLCRRGVGDGGQAVLEGDGVSGRWSCP